MALRTISADSHVTEPGDCYAERIDPRFRDRAPTATTDDTMGAVMDIDNGRSRIPYGMIAAAGRPAEAINPFHYVPWEELHPGGWDPAARLDEQTLDGVDAEVLYPSVGMLLCNHPDADYKKACFDAYNLWITEFQAHAPDRLVGLGQTALRSVEEGVADLERICELGLRGAMLPGFAACHDPVGGGSADRHGRSGSEASATSGVGDYDDPRWDPLWRAAVELGLPLSFHILTSNEAPGGAGFRGPRMNSFLGIIRGCQDIVGTLVFGGVFERHPALRVVCVEADAGWLPHWTYRADHAFERHRGWLTAELTRPPSTFVRENVYVTFQDDPVAFRVADMVNHERLLWANDHPHSDSTWPLSQAVVAEHTAGMAPDVRDDILWRSCARLYGLDVPERSSVSHPGARMQG